MTAAKLYPVAGFGDVLQSHNLKSFTIIVTCVGVGNVSQLASDLLIKNLNCSPAAHLDFEFLPAVLGYDPFSSTTSDTMTCAQLYVNREKNIAILQVRSAPLTNYSRRYVGELASFLVDSSFGRIVLLSSSFVTQQRDSDILGSPLRYTLSGSFGADDMKQLQSLGVPALRPQSEDTDDCSPPTHSTTFRLVGCGIATRLFDALAFDESKPAVCLFNMFASEGDNAGDALFMVHVLNQWLNLLPQQVIADTTPHDIWVPPSSWSLLYGSHALNTLY